MRLFDKMKKILFDEEVEENIKEKTPSNNVEKRTTMKRSQGGFIDYHHSDDTTDLKEVVETIKKEPEVVEEEDTIKEIIIPKEEKKSFKFPIDDPDDDIMTKVPARSEVRLREEKMTSSTPKSTVNDLLRNMSNSSPTTEEKKEIIEREIEYKSTKKPFRVTPVISPVYGIIGDYESEDEEVKVTEHIKVKETRVDIKRSFGPVSYNDKPLPKKELKKDLAELNKSISDLANGKDEEIIIPTKKKNIEEEISDEEDIIQTDNYDDYPDIYSEGINSEELANNNIEDALESTNELEMINEKDKAFEEDMQEEVIEENNLDVETEKIEEYEEEIIEEEDNPTKDLDEVLNSEMPEEEVVEDEDAHLDDTIETDLFNLIDSMYKDEDEEKDE